MDEWAPWDTTDGEENVLALLAFVDDFQADLSALGDQGIAHPDTNASLPVPSASLSGSAPAPAAPKAKPKSANSSTARRMRQREEMILLRGKVRDLELQLCALESKKRSRSEDATPDGRNGDRPAPPVPMWERLAQRQYEERNRAEQENARLQQMLAQQIKLAKSMERLMEKSAKVHLFGSLSGACVDCTDSPLESPQVEEELFASLPGVYAQLDTAFQDPRFQTVESQFSDVKVCFQDGQALTFEFLTARIVPFDLDATSKVTWQYYHQAVFEEDHITNSMDNVVMKTFQGPLDNRQRTIEVRGKIVARRYVEADRTVIVSSAIAEPLHVFGTPMHGVLLRHHAWRVVHRPQNPKLRASDEIATQVQLQQVIKVEKQHNLLTFGVQDVEDAMQVWNTRMDSEEQVVENLLIQLQVEDTHSKLKCES